MRRLSFVLRLILFASLSSSILSPHASFPASQIDLDRFLSLVPLIDPSSIPSNASVADLAEAAKANNQSESLPNPIAKDYPTQITGTLNASYFVIPIDYAQARAAVPAKYPILTDLIKKLWKRCNTGPRHTVLRLGNSGLSPFRFPFIDVLNDGHTPYTYLPTNLLDTPLGNAAGTLYGIDGIDSKFTPSKDPYAYRPGANHKGPRVVSAKPTFRGIGEGFSAVFTDRGKLDVKEFDLINGGRSPAGAESRTDGSHHFITENLDADEGAFITRLVDPRFLWQIMSGTLRCIRSSLRSPLRRFQDVKSVAHVHFSSGREATRSAENVQAQSSSSPGPTVVPNRYSALLETKDDLYPRIDNKGYMSLGDFVAKFGHFKEGETDENVEVLVRGRVNSLRLSGSKLLFIDLIQEGNRLQGLCNLARLSSAGIGASQFTDFAHGIGRGDIYDDQSRIRHRHVDLLVNKRSAEVLRLRTDIIEYIRSRLQSSGYIEVQTPILAKNAGGAIARPFQTAAVEFPDRYVALRTAPELWLKRLILAGFDRVFEIGPCFRNEGAE
ncbi:MAG: hypothetical protein LQ351_001160 [Letrouitia transgressa]|nr:MAG: hypothetical protein LQ351_001160 [Letrouitia transgressa]